MPTYFKNLHKLFNELRKQIRHLKWVISGAQSPSMSPSSVDVRRADEFVQARQFAMDIRHKSSVFRWWVFRFPIITTSQFPWIFPLHSSFACPPPPEFHRHHNNHAIPATAVRNQTTQSAKIANSWRNRRTKLRIRANFNGALANGRSWRFSPFCIYVPSESWVSPRKRSLRLTLPLTL